MSSRMKWILAAHFVLVTAIFAYANDFYTHGSFPAPGSPATSAGMRAELDLISAGFDKLPTFSGNASKAVIVNGSATALGLTTGTLSLAGNFATAGAYATTFTMTGATGVTFPTTGTLSTLAGSETLTTKTFNLTSNTLVGTIAQFNTALSDGDFATLAGAESLSNKTIPSPVLSGTVTGTYNLGGTSTITAPTINSPSISAPTFSGASSGSLSGFAATNAVLTTSTVAADPTTSLGIASKQYVDNGSSHSPIINGNMEIWQRGTTFAAAANGAYTADRWKWRQVGTTAVVTVNRSTNVPTVAQAGVLFNYSLEVDVTTADAAVAAGDIAILETDIEGYNWRHFAQRTFIVSFWVRDTITGSHYLALANTSEDTVNNINYLGAYTITSSDTWEYKTVQVTASPSAGTWDYTNGIGLRLKFILMAGTNYNGATEGQWNGGGSQAVANSPANSLSNTANFFRITGVKLELGSIATPIQYVPFEEELARCQRYYQKSFVYATAPAVNVGLGTGEEQWYLNIGGAVSSYSSTITFPTLMRTTPTVTLYNPSATNANVRNTTDSTDHTGPATDRTDRKFMITSTGLAGSAANEIMAVHWAADAEL